jgi:predicted DNA-binding transcriptional regulator AlpA
VNFKDFINLTETVNLSTEHEILNMYWDKVRYKIEDISEFTGVSPAGIYRILQKYSIHPQRRLETSRYFDIYQYADSGVPVRKISELTGYSRRQVYNILDKRKPNDGTFPFTS